MKEEAEKIFKETYKGNEESLQGTLLVLKNMGCTQVEIVKLLISELNIPLREADAIVLDSNAWQAEKGDTLKWRDGFGEALSE